MKKKALSTYLAIAWRNPYLLSVIGLFLLFFWFYGRFTFQLYLVMDDYIETRYNLAKSLPVLIVDSFSGKLNWSGYRPLTYIIRALLSHWFRLETVSGYYLYSFSLHLGNTLLVLVLARRLFAHWAWALLAALIFLLLPSHNEAVFYMSANANLTALFFALVTVVLALYRERWTNQWIGRLAWVAYALAVLAYEVMLPLPLLIWLLEWWLTGHAVQRKQVRFYLGLALVSLALLGVRYWAMGERITPARADYAVSSDLWHVGRGYVILLGQMVLLHTSAWPHLPLFLNVREWLSVWDERSLTSIAIMLFALFGWLLLLRRESHQKVNTLRSGLTWSILWLLIFSLPFAMLSGRNPENRYVYIPSVGFAIGVTALFVMLYQITFQKQVLRALALCLPILLLGFYAYVNTSDAAEWVRASDHAETFLEEVQELVQTFPPNSHIFQLGVPPNIGTAYVFATEVAFSNAMRWIYNDNSLQVHTTDEKLRAYLRSPTTDRTQTYLLVYDADTYTTHLVDWVEDCTDKDLCTRYPLTGAIPSVEPERQVTFNVGVHLLAHKFTWIYRMRYWAAEPVMTTCWMLDNPAPVDYTFYVHFTDQTGDTTIRQADHQLRQAYPFDPVQTTTKQWPTQQPICDLTYLTEDDQTPGAVAVQSIRGGIWVPEESVNLAIETASGYTLDQYGKIIFGAPPIELY